MTDAREQSPSARPAAVVGDELACDEAAGDGSVVTMICDRNLVITPPHEFARRVLSSATGSGSGRELVRDSEGTARDMDHIARDSSNPARDTDDIARDSTPLARDTHNPVRDTLTTIWR